MRLVIYGAVLLAALSAAIASCHVPKAGLELRTFRKVSDAEFSVMREEAVRLVREGLTQHTRYPGERYLEISCHGIPVMLVDNSLEQSVVVLYANREIDVSCVVPLLSYWSRRIVPTPDGLLVNNRKLVRSSGDRIMMCRHSAEDAQGGIAASMTNFREILRGREAGESSHSTDAAL